VYAALRKNNNTVKLFISYYSIQRLDKFSAVNGNINKDKSRS